MHLKVRELMCIATRSVSVMTVGAGMIPKNQVNAEQVESYMAQERGKRRELLHKFLQSCSTSKVLIL